ncbi:hypothetical protein DFH29DRAFT_880386 [Suillus ampliporus]|nr:hypothetical protein DFH29DRAFT_880386 [Suillus ampliporus]
MYNISCFEASNLDSCPSMLGLRGETQTKRMEEVGRERSTGRQLCVTSAPSSTLGRSQPDVDVSPHPGFFHDAPSLRVTAENDKRMHIAPTLNTQATSQGQPQEDSNQGRAPSLPSPPPREVVSTTTYPPSPLQAAEY